MTLKEVMKMHNFKVNEGNEVKTKCTNCGKHFMVSAGVMASEIKYHGTSKCPSCYKRTMELA
jgi:DNA-directed RNA polymerase subunit RPC12/RpoP